MRFSMPAFAACQLLPPSSLRYTPRPRGSANSTSPKKLTPAYTVEVFRGSIASERMYGPPFWNADVGIGRPALTGDQ
jgi:hypothetical protein